MIGVYTALFGIYDEPPPAPYGGVLFTDQPVEPEGWEVRRVERPHPDPRYASRYYFDQSCLAMPDCDYTVMHGANAQLKLAPEALVELLPEGVDIAASRHPRKSAYREANACVRMGKDDPEVIRRQMKRYRHEGFPASFPLTACTLLVHRNTERLAEFETLWWSEVKRGSCRDQLCFDYCRWKLRLPIFYLSERWTHYVRVGMHAHKRRRES